MGREYLISPELQLTAIAANAAIKGRRIVRVVEDIDQSGRSFTRRKVGKVVEEIQAGAYRHVTLWKWSRWGRNTQESLKWLGKVESAGGMVESASEDIDQRTAAGRFSRDIIMRVDEFLSDQIGETWKATQQRRRTAGLPHTGRARFGYIHNRRAPRPEDEYVPDPELAPLLRAAYERYAAGESLRSIVIDWNARGITTPVRAKVWTPQSLGRMLDTGFGAGLIRERSRPTGREGASNVMRAFDVWREGVHQPVIDRQTWDIFKARREEQSKLSSRLAAPAHALSGLLFCGAPTCNHRLHTAYSGQRHTHVWRCVGSEHRHPEFKVNISNKKALQEVMQWVFDNAAGGGEDVEARARRLAAAERATSDSEKCRRRISQIEAKAERARELYLSGADRSYTLPKYQKDVAAHEADLAAARAALGDALARMNAAGADSVGNFTSLADHWEDFAPEDLNIMLRKVIGKATVQPAPPGCRRASHVTDRLSILPRWEAAPDPAAF